MVIEDPTSGKLKKKRRNKRAKSKRKRKVKVKRNAKRNVKRRPRARGRQPPPVINIDNTTYWPIGNEEEIPHRPRAPRKTGPAGQRALEARDIRIVHTYEAQRDAGGVAHMAPPIGRDVDDNAPAVQIVDPPPRPPNPFLPTEQELAAAVGVSASSRRRLAEIETHRLQQQTQVPAGGGT